MRKIVPSEVSTLLGGVTPSAFMKRHWQRRLRLIRAAIPDFRNLLTLAELRRLATRDDVESRLIMREGQSYELEHGPFSARRLRALPTRGWTLLIQGLNLHLDAADMLLRRFSFIPAARTDDVMVSYATPGAGVGPHFDSYDVFLLQGEGRRRWDVSRQRDLSLREDTPVKLLRRFVPQSGWILDAGDMLYLPPHIAHDGVAIDECMTYSIGFRTPGPLELSREFLAFLEDGLPDAKRFADPGRAVATRSAAVPQDLAQWARSALERIRWTDSDIARFLGEYLSNPAPVVHFTRPLPALDRASFVRALQRQGIGLQRGSRMLYDDNRLYLNGRVCAEGPAARWLRPLPAARMLPATGSPAARARRVAPVRVIALLHECYRNGEMELLK